MEEIRIDCAHQSAEELALVKEHAQLVYHANDLRILQSLEMKSTEKRKNTLFCTERYYIPILFIKMIIILYFSCLVYFPVWLK